MAQSMEQCNMSLMLKSSTFLRFSIMLVLFFTMGCSHKEEPIETVKYSLSKKNYEQVDLNVSNTLVNLYNQKEGTNFRTLEALQDAIKVMGYNEKEGTTCKDLDEVRMDYNRKNSTNFKSNKEFRDWIAKRRRLR